MKPVVVSRSDLPSEADLARVHRALAFACYQRGPERKAMRHYVPTPAGWSYDATKEPACDRRDRRGAP